MNKLIVIDARPAQNAKAVGVTTYTNNLVRYSYLLQDNYNYGFLVDSNMPFDHISFPVNSKIILTEIGRGRNMRDIILRDYYDNVILPKLLYRNRASIYHQPDYVLPLRKLPFKTVATFHDTIMYNKSNYNRTFANLRNKILISRSAIFASHIVTVSDYSRQKLVNKFNIDENRITKIWNGVSNSFRMSPNDQQHKSCMKKLSYNGKYILYYGGYGPRKNVDIIMNIAKDMFHKYGVKLVLCGKSDVELNKEIQYYKFSEYVVNFDFASEYELVSLLKECQAFIFPSLDEGFGLPVAEAMSAGAPVICSDRGSLPEIAGDAAIYFEPTATETLKRCIKLLITNDKLRNNMKRKSYEVSKKFTWENNITQLNEIYKKLLLH